MSHLLEKSSPAHQTDRCNRWRWISTEACCASNKNTKAIPHNDNGKGHARNRKYGAKQTNPIKLAARDFKSPAVSNIQIQYGLYDSAN